MKLFVFEPYEWDYCGGAIGAIAETFDEAVDLIVESKRRRLDDFRGYEKYHFSRNKNGFTEDHYNQWLLTTELEVSDDSKPEVVFDNWNWA
jgi:hypothetical protein